MRVDNPAKEHLREMFKNLNEYIESAYSKGWIKYVDLGSHVVRVINYSSKFTPLIEKQLTYSLKERANSYDSTLVIWQEENIAGLPAKMSYDYDPKRNLKFRIETLVRNRDKKDDVFRIFDKTYSIHNPLIEANSRTEVFSAYDSETNTYYYGVKNLEPEEFIKQGHIFVKIFNRMLKTPTTNLVHGAVVGLENFGVLFCARGQRGKSTLAVLSMLKGFEYVSDDYLVLEKDNDELFAHPIYSIITLSPKMYNELYDELDGTRFVSNNARKDKYVINIANYHHRFRRKYPVKVCMFPQIVPDEKPGIVRMENKGRAITQLIHSTINQMQDKHDIKTIKKLIDMVKDFDFYQINLCPDIYANVECLRTFIKSLNTESLHAGAEPAFKSLETKEKKKNELCIK